MRRVILLVTVSATMLAMCALPVLAQDSTGQAPNGSICKVKPPKASAKGGARYPIQAAVNKDACATILLAPGTYRENVHIDRNVTIRGVEGDERTFVDGGGKDSVFDNSTPVLPGEGDPDVPLEGSTVTLTGLTITGGDARVRPDLSSQPALGGGIFNAGSLTLNDCTIRGNRAATTGGGIVNYDGSAMLNNSIVSGNTGGGIYAGYGVGLNNSTVSGNTGYGISSYEGGVYLYNNSVVRNNDGGGINADSSQIELNDSAVSNNTSRGDASGISNYEGDITLNNSTVSGNTAQGNGGGLYVSGTDITLSDSTISGNTAQGNGGGVYIRNYARITLLGDSGIENNSPDDVYTNENY